MRLDAMHCCGVNLKSPGSASDPRARRLCSVVAVPPQLSHTGNVAWRCAYYAPRGPWILEHAGKWSQVVADPAADLRKQMPHRAGDKRMKQV